MERFNKYQKIQLTLAVLIIIAAIAFARAIVRNKNTKNFATKETSIGAIERIKEPEKEETNMTDVQEILEAEEDTSWDEQDVEDTKVDMEEENKKEENEKASYYIKVNYTANCVTIYKKDASGNYTIPVKALICSTGTATPTSGVYKTSDKYRWHQLNGGVYGQYCTRITGHILFHSVPSSSNTPDSLKYVAYDKLGTRASAGCVRLTVEGARWIYNNCASGTYVEFYSSANPGPLGKPTAQKISSNVQCRNWDPTDPDPRNPWRTYVETVTTEPVKQDMQNQNLNTQENTEQIQQKTETQSEPEKQEETKQDNNTSQEQAKQDEPKKDDNNNKDDNNTKSESENTGAKPEDDTKSTDDKTQKETGKEEKTNNEV